MSVRRITPVILAGGSGTRLWPASREALPKQFCKLFEGPSLFQQTLQRIADAEIFAPPVIVTSEAYASLVETQLAERGVEPAAIICEPAGRDTAPAIALAAECSRNHDTELMLVLPSDHAMRDPEGFKRAILKGRSLAERDGCIVTFGIKPSHPETGFGYLRAGTPVLNGSGFLLEAFIEKPDRTGAEALVRETNVYWNAGIFLFDRDIVLAEYDTHASKLISHVRQAALTGKWRGGRFLPGKLPFIGIEPISFDYAIMERTQHAAVVPADPKWSDLGSWNAVWKQAERDANSNLLQGNVLCVDTRNSLAVSDGPVVGIAGLEDIVVVANRDAVLVTSRENSQAVKKLVETMRDREYAVAREHPGESRPWGRFDSIDCGDSHQVKRIAVTPGGRLSLQYHHHRAEHWIVVVGQATVTVGDTVSELHPGQSIFIPQGAVHRLENFTDKLVEIIEVQYGSYLGEDDIVRVEDIYGRDPVDSATTSIANAA